ncbi:MAG: helix-hairpin-helix domain-containing protein, partial [Bacteroidales bacterium]|nr:helix-hairpin-helix domain-containing protein [Bacteroidales bacterium]
MEEGKKKGKSSLKGSFVTGAIALVFLIIGYEVALFVHRAAVTRIEANRDHPDTVYIVQTKPSGEVSSPAKDYADASPAEEASSSAKNYADAAEEASSSGSASVFRRNAPHSPGVEKVREQTRRVESFRFNPNTVSVEDLQRLGFSEKQAQAIENYRQKGGRFRRKADFAKSYVVADSVFARLEPFIDLPKLDINKAD